MLIKRLVIPVSRAKEPWWISIYWSSKGTYRKGTGDIFLGPGYVRGRFLSAFTASWVKRLTAIHQIAVFVSRIIFIWNHNDHFWKFSISFFRCEHQRFSFPRLLSLSLQFLSYSRFLGASISMLTATLLYLDRQKTP